MTEPEYERGYAEAFYLPEEDRKLMKEIHDKATAIITGHFKHIDDALALMIREHGGAGLLKAVDSRFKRYAKFRMRHYHIQQTKIFSSQELRTIVTLEYKGKKVATQTIVDKLADSTGRCLSCGKKH